MDYRAARPDANVPRCIAKVCVDSSVCRRTLTNFYRGETGDLACSWTCSLRGNGKEWTRKVVRRTMAGGVYYEEGPGLAGYW